MTKKKEVANEIKIGNFVRLHTQYGQQTGLVVGIDAQKPKRPQELLGPKIATIVVTHLGGKIKRYRRPLFKLRRVDL